MSTVSPLVCYCNHDWKQTQIFLIDVMHVSVYAISSHSKVSWQKPWGMLIKFGMMLVVCLASWHSMLGKWQRMSVHQGWWKQSKCIMCHISLCPTLLPGSRQQHEDSSYKVWCNVCTCEQVTKWMLFCLFGKWYGIGKSQAPSSVAPLRGSFLSCLGTRVEFCNCLTEVVKQHVGSNNKAKDIIDPINSYKTLLYAVAILLLECLQFVIEIQHNLESRTLPHISISFLWSWWRYLGT